MIDNFDGCLCYVFLVCFWDNKLYGKLFVLVFFIGNNGIIVFK